MFAWAEMRRLFKFFVAILEHTYSWFQDDEYGLLFRGKQTNFWYFSKNFRLWGIL